MFRSRGRGATRLEVLYDLTAAPGPSSFSLIIGRALEVMEERHGGGEARGWKEKDYQRVLAGLLQMAGERFRVLTEAEPADRSRLDIYIEDVGGSARALLELKLDSSEAVSRHARQLLRYRDELRARAGPTSSRPYPARPRLETRMDGPGAPPAGG